MKKKHYSNVKTQAMVTEKIKEMSYEKYQEFNDAMTELESIIFQRMLEEEMPDKEEKLQAILKHRQTREMISLGKKLGTM